MPRRAVFAALIVACGATQTDPPDVPLDPPRRDASAPEGGAPTTDAESTLDDGSSTVVVVDDASVDAGPDARKDEPECTTSASIAAPAAPAAGLTLLAYGPIGFSGTQGKCGWSYGYVAPATSTTFVAMGQYDAVGEAWYVQNGVFWTFMNRNTMHPNGVTTSGGRTAVDHWAVRRWTSNVTGSVRVKGYAKKTAGGNGTVARIVVGAQKPFEQTIVDDVGAAFDVIVNVAIDQAIDFVLDPNASDDGGDSTDFVAAIWR